MPTLMRLELHNMSREESNAALKGMKYFRGRSIRGADGRYVCFATASDGALPLEDLKNVSLGGSDLADPARYIILRWVGTAGPVAAAALSAVGQGPIESQEGVGLTEPLLEEAITYGSYYRAEGETEASCKFMQTGDLRWLTTGGPES